MVDWLTVDFWRAIDWLQTYSGAVTAFATIWISIFTIVLTIVGGRQAKLTRRSAEIAERALTELEAPFVALKIMEPGITRKYNETGHDFQTIKFCITNHGRTPAQLIELTDLLALRPKSEGLPPEAGPDAASRNTMPYGVIAPPNGESQPFTNNLFAFMLVNLVEGKLPLQENAFFFYGFIRYMTIFRETFRVGFCFRFDLFSEKWLLTGGEKYNYCKKERKVILPNGFEVYRSYDTDNIPSHLRGRPRRNLIDRALKGLRGGDK